MKHCVITCLAVLLAAVWTALAYGATIVKQNGYVYASMTDGTITSLKFDGRGLYNYGMETVAAGGGIRGCSSMTLSGRVLTIYPVPGAYIEWDLPFVRAGYYDADTHLNYPNDRDTLGATPLVLPFRCFVASSGHYLRIEYFKRIAPGYYFDSARNINLRNGSRLLMQGDVTQNWDIETTWQTSQTLLYDVLEDRLTLKAQASGPLTIEVLQRGTREAPANAFLLPRVTFVPDSSVTFEPTQKTVSISELATELLRFGTYWYHNVPWNGEWTVCADMHLIDDPRTWYAKEMPAKLKRDQAWIGYDRFGHFGHAYVWSNFPDYGAGGFLNHKPGHAPYELRMLHNNGIRIRAIVNYVLATGDTSFLRTRRTRVVKTNGAETQPICGSGADMLDYVLSPGDIRYDGTPAGTHSSLGQEFTATASFSSVAAYLGNPSTDEANSGKITLYDRFGGAQLAQRTFSLCANTSQDVWLSIGQTLPPGKYYLEVTDNYSGTRYFGPHVAWWTKPDGNYTGGNSYNCGYSGDIEADLNLMFDYMRNYMGAARENVAYYQNDPNFTTNYRSGRNGVGTTTSYWEGAGGGYDAYVALFYVDACSAMASLYDYLGDATKAAQYRQMRALAEEKYRSLFWHTVVENGKSFSRFHGCKDWDGAIHDFGFTMYNLEAAARGIASPEQCKSIFWWLDRGQYSPDGGLTWRDGIYSVWEVVPPFNTIENYSRAPNYTWLNLTGSLPWLNVLTNGGARLDTAARDLVARSKYLSVDNMHERNEQILARFASPDKLTGGRTRTNVPGGVPTGRWFFLGPDVDLGDIEGFREIFVQDSLLATAQPISYLGMCYTGWGLQLRPRVPSDYESVRFSNIAYGGAVFDFKSEAQREAVLEISGDQKYTVPSNAQVGQTFIPASRFNKVALRVSISPFTTKRDNQLTITLYSRASGGTWAKRAENWYSHAKDGQWVWVSTDDPLPPGVEYLAAVSAVRPAAGETIKLYHNPSNVYASGSAMLNGSQIAGDFALRAVYEKTKLTVESVYDPRGQSFVLRGPRAGTTITNLSNGLRRLETVLEPDESALLTLRSSRTYHVKPDGDDSADGLSLQTAWRSIANGDQKGILAPGDVVLVEPGTYPAVTISNCCGMQGLPITYRANGPVTLLCAVGPALTIDSGASWTSVEGFEITGQTQPAGHAILVRAQAGVTLAGLYIHDTTDYDYTVKLDGVRGAVVRNCITRGKPGQWNWLIYNCTDTKIMNNVFDGGYVQLFSWNGGSSGPGSTGTLVVNNIFRGAGNAIFNWDDLYDLVHGYNCFWNNVNNYPQTTVTGPGEITADPRFPVGSPPDYHLVPGSPAIDAGTDVGLAYVGSRPDMGAIEADYANITALADIWDSEPGTWVHVTNPKSVTSASTTFIDGSYYVEEPSRTRGIKVMPRASGLPSVGLGSRITFSGVVRVDSNGEKYVDVYDLTRSAGQALGPIGVSNRALAGGAGMTGLLVRTWGLVTEVNSDYIYADDGTGYNDGSGNGTGIRIVLRGLANPITKTFVKGVTYVKGVTGLVGRDTGGVLCLRPRSDADIQL